MMQVLGVFNSDSVNRYGMRFSVGALFSALWDNFEMGNPSLLAHDFTRPIGWTKPTTLHLEPGLTRLVGLQLLADNAEESDVISRSLADFLLTKSEAEAGRIAKLKGLMSSHLRGDEEALCTNCVTLVGPGLAARVVPEIFDDEDKDGLVDLNKLTSVAPGVFKIGELVLFAHHFFRRSLCRINSLNTPFLVRLQDLAQDGAQIKIALDRDMVGLASSLVEHFELEYWWGPKFSDNLASIPQGTAHHEATERERLFHGISGTQFQWLSRDGCHIFQAEELRDRSSPSLSGQSSRYACRYVHSIVNESTAQAIHLDGAVRAYSEEQMLRRLDVDISDSGYVSDYTKLWRIDRGIDVSFWKRLVSDYFRDNRLVGEYLGADEDNAMQLPSVANQPDILTVQNYVPYSMRAGDGVRLALSLHPSADYGHDECRIAPLDVLSSDNQRIDFVESETIELIKICRRLKHPISMPEGVSVVTFKDSYVNLPLIVHGGDEMHKALKKTLHAIGLLIGAWNEAGHDRVVSYTVGFPIQGKACRISVMGHVTDLHKWLAKPLSTPPTSLSGIRSWIERVSDNLGATFKLANDTPPLADILQTSGVLLVKRRPIEDPAFRLRYSDQHRALVYKLVLGKGETALADSLERGEISPSLAIQILQSKCRRCGASYRDCDCSKMLDEGVEEEITDMRVAFPFWTDRPAQIVVSE